MYGGFDKAIKVRVGRTKVMYKATPDHNRTGYVPTLMSGVVIFALIYVFQVKFWFHKNLDKFGNL